MKSPDIERNDSCEESDSKNHRFLVGQPPTIFSDRMPAHSICYFGGPWLPDFHDIEFGKYARHMKHPLQILEMPERRKSLVDAILKLRVPDPQKSLFANDERQHIESLFDELLALKNSRRPLYKRWSKLVNGKIRDLSVPQKALDILLREYIHSIIMRAPCHQRCHGGEKGWSVRKSLETHVPIGAVFSFDMSDAFRSTSSQYVFDFYYTAFESKFSDQDIKRDFAGFLTTLSTVYYKEASTDALPQGSPIGTALFNRILYPLDKIIHFSAARRELTYTRWIDDFIISSRSRTYSPAKLFRTLQILREDFPIHHEKNFFQQDLPAYYLLGHKIAGDSITPVSKDEFKKSRGLPISGSEFYNQFESMSGLEDDADWTTDDLEDLKDVKPFETGPF